jgi:hypothetical protein
MSFYSNLKAGDPRRQTLEDYRSQTASIAEQYGFQDISAEIEGTGGGSNWDPLTGNIYGDSGMGVSANGGPAPQYGEVLWQDSSRIKWDGLDPVTYVVDQKSETRQRDFFQSDVTIQLPYHGAVAKAEAVDDDSATPPAKMLKVTVTMPDNSTDVCVHNCRQIRSTSVGRSK